MRWSRKKEKLSEEANQLVRGAVECHHLVLPPNKNLLTDEKQLRSSSFDDHEGGQSDSSTICVSSSTEGVSETSSQADSETSWQTDSEKTASLWKDGLSSSKTGSRGDMCSQPLSIFTPLFRRKPGPILAAVSCVAWKLKRDDDICSRMFALDLALLRSWPQMNIVEMEVMLEESIDDRYGSAYWDQGDVWHDCKLMWQSEIEEDIYPSTCPCKPEMKQILRL